ncbi:hypothetical protein ACIP79_27400 [Streptomyces sp. NPDC088747]|uniref:hypothetical protein n=1 Tax=Streptomyces sp. NPDC088747 TaxID=3365886 RepID=UPI00380F3FF9
MSDVETDAKCPYDLGGNLRTKSRRSLAVVTAAILALLAPVTATADAIPAARSLVATAAEDRMANTGLVQEIGDKPSKFHALPEESQVSPQSDCTETKRNLKVLRESGQKQVVCFEWQTREEFAETRGLSSSSTVVWCGTQSANQVWVTRDSICSVRGVVIVIMDTTTGVVYGKAYGAVEQEIDTQNAIPEFFEYMKFDLYTADVATEGMTVEVKATCSLDTSCQQSSGPWDAPRPIVAGGSIDGTFTRLWPSTPAGNKSFLISYVMTVNVNGLWGNTKWGGNGDPGDGQYLVRCDFQVSAYAGCVVPAFTPTFEVSTKYPQARAFVGMVQASMSTHPGWEGHGQPLHRESSEIAATLNRAVVCDSTFTPNASTPPPVQCDEWPFAKSKESGRQFGVTSGTQCQQYSVVSQTIDGKVYVSLTWPGANQGKMPPASAKCARASMPKVQNEGVGGDLGRKTTEWRLLENDAYWVDAGQP